MYRKYIKRLIDFILSVMTVTVLLPVYGILALVVRVIIGKPILFSQERTTLNGRKFRIHKFRTMNEQKDENGNYLPDDVRLTPVGRVLRATSLDELPEIFAIVSGNMSIIGPRPLPAEYDAYYTEREKSRFNVRAGLIPPEVLYKNIQPTWTQQLEYERAYAENVTFLMDIKILYSVILGLFKRYNCDYGEYVRESLSEERKGELLKDESVNTSA